MASIQYCFLLFSNNKKMDVEKYIKSAYFEKDLDSCMKNCQRLFLMIDGQKCSTKTDM